jgi:hypothetical protein
MKNYLFELVKECQDLCTIIAPFGKYKFLRLLMGLKCSPYINQAACFRTNGQPQVDKQG